MLMVQFGGGEKGGLLSSHNSPIKYGPEIIACMALQNQVALEILTAVPRRPSII